MDGQIWTSESKGLELCLTDDDVRVEDLKCIGRGEEMESLS